MQGLVHVVAPSGRLRSPGHPRRATLNTFQRMSEPQVLIDWLQQVARRLRWRRHSAVAASVTFWLLILLLAWQVIRAVVPEQAVASALLPLLIMAAVGLAAWALFRMWRKPSLDEAAFAADGLGGWHDQIKSALWFAQSPRVDPGVEVLLQRTHATVAAADPRKLLPLGTPRMLYGALGTALLCGLMAWWSPRLAYPEKQSDESGSARAWTSGASTASKPGSTSVSDTGAGSAQARSGIQKRAGQGAANADSSVALADAEATSAPATEGAAAPVPPAAPAEEGPSRTDVAAERRVARNTPQETPTEWLGSVVERLKEMLQKGDLDSDGEGVSPGGEAQGGARVNPSDRGNQQDLGSASPDTRMRNPDNTGGSQLNLNALGGIGPRDTLPGDVAGEEQSGRNNNSNTGPLGRRISSSRGGPGDGDDEVKGDPGGSSQSPAVLGRKTERLALQLRRVPSPTRGGEDPAKDDPGSAEEFFAATRSQAARTAATPGAGPARSGAPADALSATQTPLAWRGAVKDYSLSQHRREK